MSFEMKFHYGFSVKYLVLHLQHLFSFSSGTSPSVLLQKGSRREGFRAGRVWNLSWGAEPPPSPTPPTGREQERGGLAVVHGQPWSPRQGEAAEGRAQRCRRAQPYTDIHDISIKLEKF